VNDSQLRLTPREVELLDLTGHGMKAGQIAAHLGIRLSTVRNHYRNLYAKLGVHSRNEALLKAIRMGLIDV
jgi:DNA-binding NarL/FixJ family response regulator